MSFPKTPWASQIPNICDICHRPLAQCTAPGQNEATTFVDGVTVTGAWGIMGEGCFPIYGRGLGTGLGQQYTIETGEKLAG